MLEQLKTDVHNLTEAGTRKVGTHGHRLARTYLIQRLQQLGVQPFEDGRFDQPYDLGEETFVNIAGICPGADPALEPILIMAHYDTCGDQPGADDNGAAMAIWLEVIGQLARQPRLERDIIVVFPDAEEPPYFLTQYMGSTNFYNLQRNGPIHCGFVLDLVGHDVPLAGMEDLLFVFGAESHPGWESLLLQTTLPPGLRNIATLNRYVGDLSDHHILRENSVPYLFFTCGRWEHYHQTSDTPDKLNYTKMRHIANYLVRLITKTDKQKLPIHMGDHDPVRMEIELMHRAIGDYLAYKGISIKDRNDLQRFVLGWVTEHHL